MSVSVIIPSLNMAQFLPDAIASITRQDRAVTEIIIVDSDSRDGTADVVHRHKQSGVPIRMVQTAQSGPGAARNVGIASANCDFISFLDADDLWPAGKLARQLDYLSTFASKGMVSGFVCYFDVLDPLRLVPAPASRTETLFHVHLGTCIYRRSVLEQIGTFDETLLYAEDVDLLLRLREAGIDFSILQAVMLYYRKHGASMMAQKNPRKTADFRRAVAKSVVRRRSAGLPAVDLNSFEAFFEPPS
jgi:glycosyltransferase involved in cell wall biosynthesis